MTTSKPQNKRSDTQTPEVIESELGTVTIFKNIVIFEGNPEVLVSLKTGLQLLMRVVAKVGSRPIVYISNRVHNYAVDPNDYKYLEMLPNLIGMVVVGELKKMQHAVDFEKRFFKKPFAVFSTLEEAKSWAEQLLAKRTNE